MKVDLCYDGFNKNCAGCLNTFLILSSETVLGVAEVLKPRCSLMGKNLITNTKAAVEDGLELERLTN